MQIAEDRLPTRWQSLLFEAKACVFRWRRSLLDLPTSVRRQFHASALRDAPVLAEFRSPLWPAGEAAEYLVAGKIHNLRVAARSLNGIEVPPGEVFSFWKQVGRARKRRGFVMGRELREGCLVPAIGGGLCQLSGALYYSAVRAGLEVVERHRHSRVVPGSLAENDRDATVFWNYLDLRFRAPWPWRLEFALDERELHVSIRGHAPAALAAVPLAPALRKPVPTEDCASCGETECHRYQGVDSSSAYRTWLVEDDWPEFSAYRKAEKSVQDRVLDFAHRAGLRERIAATRAKAARRWLLWRGKPLPQARLGGHQLIAGTYARRLGYKDTHLVVPQSVLPFLWLAGELNGRSFDVLMTALPMHEIQRRLDKAFALHPSSRTLSDFRADPTLAEAERSALERARHWITPHAEILRMAGGRALPLPWQRPALQTTEPRINGKPRVLLPASSLARKGAIELREALTGMSIEALLPPGAEDHADFWRGFRVTCVGSIGEGVDAADIVVLPAWIEHQPRGLLRAIARGKPVIATQACGLPSELPWHKVAEGDTERLRAKISELLVTLRP
ncbi:VanW family protein [Pseudoxanthomonas sacheonensis]|uniref:VanW like protein n=1 Tax=Pseudoxanthomonas sacheonensis TaxID=443615 RepID=A0ABU1RVX3_9GAMM|nr:VanW family protein [Pseudoxanthomonas sacheonensis]MDR6842060.1 hypothetical protein [Pseudoxanthomonas sacheonensis]